MTTQPTHTPTPWFNWGTDHQGRRPTICDKAPGNGYSVGSEIGSINRDADAAYIVECCNGYAALQAENVELREALEQIAESDALKKDNAELRKAAKEVMDSLAEHGPSIVPHLMDTDDNAGERLRQAIAKAEAV